MGQSALQVTPVDTALSNSKSGHQGVPSKGPRKFIPQGMPHLRAAEREGIIAPAILAVHH